MSGFTGNDGSELAGGLTPSGIIKALAIDASGNLILAAAGVPSGSADSGNPVKVGGVAYAGAPAGVSDGQRVNAWLGHNGQIVVALADINGATATMNAPGDNQGTQTGPATASQLLVWNGTSWDRWHSDQLGLAKVSLYGKGAAAGDTALRLESTGALAGILAQESLIRWATLAGKAFTATTTTQTNGAVGNFPMCLFNPGGNTKTLVVYRIVVSVGNTSSSNAQINTVTVDPAYGTNPTILNRSIGGAASTISTTLSYTTTSQTLPGASTMLESYREIVTSPTELLVNDDIIVLPPGQGITVWNSPAGASAWAINMSWLEI